MITVSVKERDQQIIEFTITGHAESGPYGYDLVCAGVSAVSFGSVNAIHHLCNLDLVIEQQGEGGYLHVTLPESISKTQMEKAQLLLNSMLISLKTIERDYNQFIQVKYK